MGNHWSSEEEDTPQPKRYNLYRKGVTDVPFEDITDQDLPDGDDVDGEIHYRERRKLGDYIMGAIFWCIDSIISIFKTIASFAIYWILLGIQELARGLGFLLKKFCTELAFPALRSSWMWFRASGYKVAFMVALIWGASKHYTDNYPHQLVMIGAEYVGWYTPPPYESLYAKADYPSLDFLPDAELDQFLGTEQARQVRCLARGLFSEDTLPEGQRAIAWTVRNRVETARVSDRMIGDFGDSICGVINHPNQFSGMKHGANRFELVMANDFDTVHESSMDQDHWEQSVRVAYEVLTSSYDERPRELLTTVNFYHPGGMVPKNRVPSFADGCTPEHVVKNDQGKDHALFFGIDECKPLRRYYTRRAGGDYDNVVSP